MARRVLNVSACESLEPRLRMYRRAQQELRLSERVFDIAETPCARGTPPRLKGCTLPPGAEFDVLLNMGPRQPFGQQVFDQQNSCKHYFNNIFTSAVGKLDQYSSLRAYEKRYPQKFWGLTPRTYLFPEDRGEFIADYDVGHFYVAK